MCLPPRGRVPWAGGRADEYLGQAAQRAHHVCHQCLRLDAEASAQPLVGKLPRPRWRGRGLLRGASILRAQLQVNRAAAAVQRALWQTRRTTLQTALVIAARGLVGTVLGAQAMRRQQLHVANAQLIRHRRGAAHPNKLYSSPGPGIATERLTAGACDGGRAGAA